MGGSGLIVVVIVAAWALFLVPQWMHRRASAAEHLADRVPDGTLDNPESAASDQPATARPRRTYGRRHLVRTTTPPQAEDDRRTGWSVPTLPSVRRAHRSSGPVSAASRRRRILMVLALATLLASAAVAVGLATALTVPTWIVAIPGGLMVGYLVLLAVVRPGSSASATKRAARPVAPAGDDESAVDAATPAAIDSQASVSDSAQPAGDRGATVEDSAAESAAPATWTPVPVPAPTYVTAARANRSVRTIDLSNPGSWTAEDTSFDAASAAPNPVEAAGDQDEDGDEYVVEHRRVVGE